MNQTQGRIRFGRLARWQRLSIRNKLLLPIVLALAVGLFVVVVRIIPPVNALAQASVRDNFERQLDDGRDDIKLFLSQNLQDLIDLSRTAEMQDFAAAQFTAD